MVNSSQFRFSESDKNIREFDVVPDEKKRVRSQSNEEVDWRVKAGWFSLVAAYLSILLIYVFVQMAMAVGYGFNLPVIGHPIFSSEFYAATAFVFLLLGFACSLFCLVIGSRLQKVMVLFPGLPQAIILIYAFLMTVVPYVVNLMRELFIAIFA